MKLKIAVFAATFAVSLLAAAGTALASPPCPQPLALEQPSGEAVTATQHGDEWFHWMEANDGAVIVQGSDGYWRYSEYAHGRLSALPARYGIDERPAGALTGDALRLAIASSPPEGAKAASRRSSAVRRAGGIPTPDGPEPLVVILVSFTNASIQQTDAYWSGKMFNDYSSQPTKTNNFSSVNDYYKENSHNTFYFTPASETSGTANDSVIRVSLGSPHPAYPSGDDAQFSQDSWAVATAALNAADPYINFASYDTDGNREITPDELHIVMILAGGEQAYGDAGNAVWAHSYSLPSPLYRDGVNVGGDYTQQGEMQGGHPATIGVLAHELGHSLGLPDLYDYGDDSLGLGVYSLMASGNWEYNTGNYPGSSPVHLDAWCKYLLGFATPQTCTSGAHALNSIATGSYNVIRVPTSNPKQYFLLENRQNNYGYDKPLDWYFSAGGIAVYHIDEQVLDNAVRDYGGWYYINDDENHKAVDLEEANEGILGHSQLDAYYYPRNSSDPKYNHLFRTGDSACNSAFTAATTPSSNLYGGGASGVSISVVSPSSNTMSIELGLGIGDLTANKPSPQREMRTIRFTCFASGTANITYKFDLKKDGARIGGTEGYSPQNYFDWTPDTPGTGYTVTVSVLADGLTDPVTLTSGTYEILADTAAPVITATSGGAPVASGGYAKANVTISLSDPDGDDVISGAYAFNGGSPVAINPTGTTVSAEGAYAVSARDLAGNASSFSFTIDKTPPSLSAASGGSAVTMGQIVSASVTVTAADAHLSGRSATKDGAPYPWPAGGVFADSGMYVATATDFAGNTATLRFGIYPNADKLMLQASPSGSMLQSGAAVSSNVLATAKPGWTASAKKNGKSFKAGWSTYLFTAEGAYTVTAKNAATGQSVTMTFTIDRKAPVITAKDTGRKTIKQNSYNKKAIAVTAKDSTAIAYAATCNGAPYGWPAGGKFTTEGKYVVTARDAAGNAATYTFTIDLFYPAVAAVREGGAALASKGYSNVAVIVSVSDFTLSKYSVTRNGRSYAWPSGGRFTAEGSYVVTAKDKPGRTSTFRFTIDYTKPAIRGRTSGATVVSGGNYRYVTISLTETNLDKKYATKNGASIRWPSGGRFGSSGSYTVRAVDKAGNESSFSFIVDASKPVIKVTTLEGATVRSGGTARGGAVVAVTDAYFKSKTVKLGSKYIAWPEDNTFAAKGTYTITAYDVAGNKATYKFYVK
jgi:M6 family metalloprotease-like protein